MLLVQADVAGFYESISHDQLEDDLVKATGDSQVATALKSFLFGVMGTRRGVPQGLLPSDTLATVYLQPVDEAVARGGFEYWRHGDDMRVAVGSSSRAREAIALIESELRDRGLLLSPSKVAILTREQFEADLKAGDNNIRALREDLFKTKLELISSDQDELIAAMDRAKLDEQWGWELFYHGRVSLDEVIEELRPHLDPTDEELAAHLVIKALERAPGTADALPKEQFHFLISHALVRLAALRSPAAIDSCASIIARFPDKTELVCHYLQSVAESNGESVASQIENILQSELFTTPWQQAWLFRSLGMVWTSVSGDVVDQLQTASERDEVHWLPRVEMIKVLARVRRLDQKLLVRCWRSAPPQYRCDLLEAAANLQKEESWASKFLAAAGLDPVEKVVSSHLQGVNNSCGTRL